MDTEYSVAVSLLGGLLCYVLGRQKQNPAVVFGCISTFALCRLFPDKCVLVLSSAIFAGGLAVVLPQLSQSSHVVIVGSSNPAKVEAVREAMKGYRRVTVTASAASSGVSDQPIGFDEITSGARNRAEACYSSNAWLSFGIESGLFVVGDGAYDVCCVSAFDGETHSLGFSCAFEIPPKARDAVFKRGLDLSQAANAAGLSSDKNIGQKGGLVAVLTNGRVTRKGYTIQAIDMAMVRVEHPPWYLPTSESR